MRRQVSWRQGVAHAVVAGQRVRGELEFAAIDKFASIARHVMLASPSGSQAIDGTHARFARIFPRDQKRERLACRANHELRVPDASR